MLVENSFELTKVLAKKRECASVCVFLYAERSQYKVHEKNNLFILNSEKQNLSKPKMFRTTEQNHCDSTISIR